MRCPNCTTELMAGAKFCHACGTRVESSCPNCGAAVRAEFRFCPECGTAIGVAKPAVDVPAPAPPIAPPGDRLGRLSQHIPRDLAEKIRGIQGTIAGERKLVSVLFCDLVGSMAIAEGMDPEEYRDLLDQYLELAFGQIYRFEGIVNQLAGDGMMALFGAPLAHEDAPYRAVQAAWEIQQALTEFNRELRGRRGVELKARIGINTGPVVVGTVGNDLKMDYTAIGDTTNLAARLQSLAAPGTILIADSTYRLVRGFFDVKPAGPLEIRGKSEPVTVYEVLGRSEITTSLGVAEARGLTPLIGREQELRQLGDCFARVCGGWPQVVTIVGDAGSGKSRLLYEFKQSLAGESVVFFEGRCSALKQKVPYAPFAVMLKHFFGVAKADSPTAACEKISAKVRPFDPELTEIYPFVCRMLSVGVAPPNDLPADEIKREIYHALARLVIKVSEHTPVVLAIEDLHWIDDSSRELLELSVAQLEHARVMMVFSHRPDFHSAWRSQAPLTQLTLRGLSDQDALAIVRAVAAGPLPADLETRILGKAEGSPFFAEELTRALFEEGYVTVEGSRAVLTRPLEDVMIPGTIREVIAARLDRLGAHSKRVLQVASALGRQFHRQQLSRLLEGEEIDVPEVLVSLERRGILHRKTFLSDDEYRFGESLTQEVAYEGLLLKERRQLHERIGLLLEAEPSDGSGERYALLAHHFVRSDNRRKALTTLLGAARNAERLPSYPTAADFYRQAWEVGYASLAEGADVDDGFRRLTLEAAANLCRMAVIYVTPNAIDVEQASTVGIDLARALGDTETLAGLYAYGGLIAMNSRRERFGEGLKLVEEGYALASRANLPETQLGISRALAFSYLFDARLDETWRLSDQMLAELERNGHRERLSDLYFGALWIRTALLAYAGDDPQAAIADALATHDLAARANNRTARSGAASVLAQLHFACGRYADAKRWADQSLEIAEVIGNLGTLRTAAAVALGSRRELGEAFSPERYLKPIEDGIAAASNLSLYVPLIVDILLSVGEVSLAHRAARLAYERAGGLLRDMLARQALGDVLSHLGAEHHAEALLCFEDVAAQARRLGLRGTLAHAELGLGRLAALAGDLAERDRQLGNARAVFTELGLVRYAARAERWLAEAEGVLADSA
jgi:class 3 adenylate cyclase